MRLSGEQAALAYLVPIPGELVALVHKQIAPKDGNDAANTEVARPVAQGTIHTAAQPSSSCVLNLHPVQPLEALRWGANPTHATVPVGMQL